LQNSPLRDVSFQRRDSLDSTCQSSSDFLRSCFPEKYQESGLPRTTSSLVQLWTPPQCAQVNLWRFTFAAGQSFSSIVRPVSVSRDVDGQRTSRLLILGSAFFGRGRGGWNRNRDGISEPVNDPRLGGIVG